jgi:hypothetical protein
VYVDPRPKEAAVGIAAIGSSSSSSSIGSFTASSAAPPLLLPSDSATSGLLEVPSADSAARVGSLPDSNSSSSSSSNRANSGLQPSYQTHPLNQTAVPEPADRSRAKRVAMRRSKEIMTAAAFPYNAVGKLTLLNSEGVPR